MRGARKRQTARRGWLVAEGATAAEAKANLSTMVDWACSAAALTVECRFNQLIVVAQNATGWNVKATPLTELEHGKQVACFTMYGPMDYAEVLQSARVHAAQNAWTRETDDEAHAAAAGLLEPSLSELKSWLRFQRSYLANIAAGMTPAEAFDKANGYHVQDAFVKS